VQITALYKTNLINFKLAERLQKLDLNVSNNYYIIISEILYFASVPKFNAILQRGVNHSKADGIVWTWRRKIFGKQKNNQINEPYLRRHIITVGAASSR